MVSLAFFVLGAPAGARLIRLLHVYAVLFACVLPAAVFTLLSVGKR